ncbi:MAG: DUF4239 domain-containing protein [Alphaproteobacteria bacterium]|nr:DUF4239 domain-containing protein [Alphaproteobacteria bacterium]
MLWSNPNLWQSLFVILAIGIAFNVVGTLLMTTAGPGAHLAPDNDLRGSKLGFLEPITSLVAVFVLSMSWIQYNEVVGRVQRETTTLILLKESAAQFSEPTRSRVLGAMTVYVEAVIGPEWLAMAANGRSEVAGQALDALVRSCGAAEARTPRDESLARFLVPVVRRLNDDREGRLHATTFELREPLLVLLDIAVVLSIIFIWAFGYPTMRTKLIMGTLYTSGLMLVVFMVSLLSHPFRGPLAVSNDAYANILQEIAQPVDALP